MHEASFFHVTPDGVLQCDLCHHYCRIRPGNSGLCRVRTNTGGALFTSAFGRNVTTSADPIEKNHVFHYLPGSTTWTLRTPGGNFRCNHTERTTIAQTPSGPATGIVTTPENITSDSLRAGCRSVSYSSTEPVIYAEYAIEVMKLTRQHGLANIWHSNGYFSRNCLDAIQPLIDAITIDLKSIDDTFYRRVCEARIAPVLGNLRHIYQSGIHLEISTTLMAGFNDDPAMLQRLARFIVRNLGPEVPWHIIPRQPMFFSKTPNIPPEQQDVIQKARALGQMEGLLHIYAGPSHFDTHCAACGMKLIARTPVFEHFVVGYFDLTRHCPACNAPSPIHDSDITQPHQ